MIFLIIHKCIMANTSAIWQQATYTTYELRQEPYNKIWREKFWKMDPQQKKITRQKEQEDYAEKQEEKILIGQESNGSPAIPDRPVFYSLKAAKAYGHYYEIIHFIINNVHRILIWSFSVSVLVFTLYLPMRFQCHCTSFCYY